MNIWGSKKKNADKPLQYEQCEVMATEAKYESNRYVFRFFAKAVSPKEKYTAHISKQPCVGSMPRHDDHETQLALNALKVQLISEGWELLTEKGSMWYNLRFRRVFKG